MPSPRSKKPAAIEKTPSEEPTVFRVEYLMRPERPVFPVSGAYGGSTPDGANVTVHFFTEYASVPSALVGEPEGDLMRSEKMRAVLRTNVTREVVGTAVMAPTVAETLGNWLIEKARAAREVAEAQAKVSDQ